MRTRLVALVSVIVLVVALAQTQNHSTDAASGGPNSVRELAGLWEAKRRLGPDIRGPLIIKQRECF
jgi:hypothetical protein